MRITKCDICKESINKTEGQVNVAISGPLHGYFDVCFSCANPILKLLESKRLVKIDKPEKSGFAKA